MPAGGLGDAPRGEALIAGASPAATHTWRARRWCCSTRAVGKDVVSRTWRMVRTNGEAWDECGFGDEDIRLVLDSTLEARIHRKAATISPLVAIGVRPATCWH